MDRRKKEDTVMDIYNPLNKEITRQELSNILSTYNVTLPIRNFELYRRAFIHNSYVIPANNDYVINNDIHVVQLSSKSNERLEFIGDGVLECVTKFYLYRRFPLENEGFMTEKKIALVKNEAIGKVALEMGLEKWFILSKQTEEKQIRYNVKKLGCLFEALLGSIFLDFNETDYAYKDKSFLSGPGFQVAQLFIESIFEKHIDWTNLIQNDDNYKNILQVKIQREFKVTPVYIEMIPYNHITGYTMGVYLCLGQSIHTLHHLDALCLDLFGSFQDIRDYVTKHGKIFLFLGEGSHRIKKKAEQIASLHFGEKKQFFV